MPSLSASGVLSASPRLAALKVVSKTALEAALRGKDFGFKPIRGEVFAAAFGFKAIRGESFTAAFGFKVIRGESFAATFWRPGGTAEAADPESPEALVEDCNCWLDDAADPGDFELPPVLPDDFHCVKLRQRVGYWDIRLCGSKNLGPKTNNSSEVQTSIVIPLLQHNSIAMTLSLVRYSLSASLLRMLQLKVIPWISKFLKDVL